MGAITLCSYLHLNNVLIKYGRLRSRRWSEQISFSNNGQPVQFVSVDAHSDQIACKRLLAEDLTGALEFAIGGDHDTVELSDARTTFELTHLRSKNQPSKINRFPEKSIREKNV